MNWIMELQAGLIRVELQVEFKECHYYSNHAISYLCKQEYSTTDVLIVKSIRQVLRLYDMASQDGFNPDIHFIKGL